jgi:hypothetical protein
MGSGWAFSAPAYCPGVVIRTELLNGFPAGVQRAINNHESGGSVKVAVEAGIKIHDLDRALSVWPPLMTVTAAPYPQTLGAQVQLSVTVRDDAGDPIAGATAAIENFDARGRPAPLELITDAAGVTSVRITFKSKRSIPTPTSRKRSASFLPGQVRAEGFQAAGVPLAFEPSAPPPAG